MTGRRDERRPRTAQRELPSRSGPMQLRQFGRHRDAPFAAIAVEKSRRDGNEPGGQIH